MTKTRRPSSDIKTSRAVSVRRVEPLPTADYDPVDGQGQVMTELKRRRLVAITAARRARRGDAPTSSEGDL
jgi:hypothetical protein